MTRRTRIKICGLRDPEHVAVAVQAGADAVGLVFYAPSPRYVAPREAAELLKAIPAYVASVGLFVNASLEEVQRVTAEVPISMLQVHGDESPELCGKIAASVGISYTCALRVRPGMNSTVLLEYERVCQDAGKGLFAGLLLDAFVDGYGGGGKVFDWSLIPKELAPRVVLSGGLSTQNAAEAIRRVHPFAVDVSSGVESAKGIKDPQSIREFIDVVQQADASLRD
jgi:phosphoribosylanthranilate isomerase